jgi:integrase
MSDFAAAAADYLATRRALGYKLVQQGQMLCQFVDYLESVQAKHISLSHALAWARQPADADPVWWSAKLCVVRGFASYVLARDPKTEIPPIGLWPERSHRIVPYIYTDDDVARLVAAAGRLCPTTRADTYQTLISLLAVTGMRVGESIRLDRSDLDGDQGLLTIRNTKFGKSRQLPLHSSALEALHAYAQRQIDWRRQPKRPSFFVSTVGTRLIRRNADAVFANLVTDAGLTWSVPHRRPRLHDLRHSFAVKTVTAWYRAGLNVQQRLPLLSTYMGHAGPAATYWYLSAVPELLELAAERIEAGWEPTR